MCLGFANNLGLHVAKVDGAGLKVTRDTLHENRRLVTLAIQNIGNSGISVDALEMHLQALYDFMELVISGLVVNY